jgi:aminotransferase
MSVRASQKASRFTESVIREMTRLANLHGAVNLSQGFPDFPAPQEVKEAAMRAVAADVNQYAITWGARTLREAIARKFTALYGVPVDPDREVTVTCGSTEAMIAALLALVDPGDEVVVFEPFYENYAPDAILSGAVPRFVKLRPPDWRFDPDELARAFGPRTRAIVLNTPNNPTGKVFSRAELDAVAELCLRHDVVADHRRDLRAHPLRLRRPRPDGDAAWHGRAHHHDQRPEQDVQRHRLARGLDHRPAGADRRDPQGP